MSVVPSRSGSVWNGFVFFALPDIMGSRFSKVVVFECKFRFGNIRANERSSDFEMELVVQYLNGFFDGDFLSVSTVYFTVLYFVRHSWEIGNKRVELALDAPKRKPVRLRVGRAAHARHGVTEVPSPSARRVHLRRRPKVRGVRANVVITIGIAEARRLEVIRSEKLFNRSITYDFIPFLVGRDVPSVLFRLAFHGLEREVLFPVQFPYVPFWIH